MRQRATAAGLIIVALIAVGLFIFSRLLPAPGSGVNGLSERDANKAAKHPSQLVFPQSVLFESETSRIFVRGAVAPMPEQSRDYLLVGWFKLRDLPQSGQRVVLLSSLDFESRAQPGIALAVRRTLDSVRAEVYWRDSRGKGRWYTFGEGDFGPRRWFMLALALRHGNVISLHTATRTDLQEQPQLKLLGAYSFPEPIIPDSTAALLLGGTRLGGFVGRAGPLGIFSRYKLAARVERVLSALVESPAQYPEELSQQDALLWSPDLISDLSARKYELLPDHITRGKDDS